MAKFIECEHPGCNAPANWSLVPSPDYGMMRHYERFCVAHRKYCSEWCDGGEQCVLQANHRGPHYT
jgi:hypothetical protein